MQRRKMTIIILVLALVSFLADSRTVMAEGTNSVKDCLENPSECGVEEVTPTGDGEGENVSDKESVGVSIWDFAKMILTTIFVVALIYGLLKFLGKRNRGYQNTALIQNIGGARVGTNRSVQIIKAGDRVFIVGVGENVNLLKELEDDDARKILKEYNNRLEQLTGQGDIVSKLLQRKKEIQENDDRGAFSSIFNKQLEDINARRKQAFEKIRQKGPKNDE